MNESIEKTVLVFRSDSSAYLGVSIVNIPRDTKESWLIECGLYLRFSDHSENCTQVSF